MTEKSKTSFDPAQLKDLLPIYYKRLFPHKPFYQWLSYGESEKSTFAHREICFTLKDDIYVRYLSFETEKELRTKICQDNPFKIDIGAVMSVRPNMHRSMPNIRPVQRELVFDIDMTDYDDIRTCCQGADVCPKCWKFMTVACRIIDTALRDDFGFVHLLWVFSGRRGIHCWVCDETARHLDTQARGAIVEYLSIGGGKSEGVSSKIMSSERMHHSIRRAHRLIEPLFDEVCLVDQNMFGTPAGVAKLLAMIGDDNFRKEMSAKLKDIAVGDSKAVWHEFDRQITLAHRNGSLPRKMRSIIEEIKVTLMYPRLDVNVTKGFNHLLKAPFCIHPKTGKICVPFNPSAASKFDPTTSPDLNLLLDEICEFDEKNTTEDAVNEDNSRIKAYKKTSMFKGVLVFEEFLRKLEQSNRKPITDVQTEF